MYSTPPTLDGVKVVCFDAMGTLFQPLQQTTGASYLQYFTAYMPGTVVPPGSIVDEHFQQAYNAQQDKYPLFGKNQQDLREWWYDIIRETFILSGVPPKATYDKVFLHFMQNLYDDYAGPGLLMLYPEVMCTFGVLKSRGYKIAILSDYDSRLPETLRNFNLTRYIDHISFCYDTGYTKPDKRSFESVCAHLNCDCADMLHIGDSVRRDYDGAQNAGAHGRLLERLKTPSQLLSINSPDAVGSAYDSAHSVASIQELLAELQPRV